MRQIHVTQRKWKADLEYDVSLLGCVDRTRQPDASWHRKAVIIEVKCTHSHPNRSTYIPAVYLQLIGELGTLYRLSLARIVQKSTSKV